MPKEEWGTKRLCPDCNTRFYDLGRDPMTCPSCGHEFSVESLAAGRGRMLVSGKATARQEEEVIDDSDDLDADADDSAIDDDLLDDDDDDADVSLDEIADVTTEDEDN